jgi:hypothetical protein
MKNGDFDVYTSKDFLPYTIIDIGQSVKLKRWGIEGFVGYGRGQFLKTIN